jgi:hypothetical protein
MLLYEIGSLTQIGKAGRHEVVLPLGETVLPAQVAGGTVPAESA